VCKIQRVLFDSLRLCFDQEEIIIRSILITQRLVDRIHDYLLYMYILEMKDVRLKLESSTPEDYAKAQTNQRTLQNLNMITLMAVGLPLALLRFFYPGGT
jgi:hypothetical protein